MNQDLIIMNPHFLKIQEKAKSIGESYQDPSHDYLHIFRVVQNAIHLQKAEGGDLNIIIPAAFLHDFIFIEKNDPRRKEASLISADAAITFLKEIQYSEKYLAPIHHAIHAHSFSAQIQCASIEAKIVQDADRLDAIGAIGIARCFSLGGRTNRIFYNPADPTSQNRQLDDQKYTVDHFAVKLNQLVEQMNTTTAKKIAVQKTEFQLQYLSQFFSEISGFQNNEHE